MALKYGINLTKDKRVIHMKNDLEEEAEVIEGMNLLKVLHNIHVSNIEDWTVRDLMELVKKSELETFLGAIAWCDFDDFYEELQKPYEGGERFVDNIEYIEFYRYMEVCKEDKTMEDYFAVHGKNDSFTEEEMNEQKDENGEYLERHHSYSISCLPINQIADKPIRIREMVELMEYDAKKDSENRYMKIAEIENGMTLFEIINTFLWDISFHGGPKNRDKFYDDLMESVKDIKEGRAKMVPAEDLFKLLDDENDKDEE